MIRFFKSTLWAACVYGLFSFQPAKASFVDDFLGFFNTPSDQNTPCPPNSNKINRSDCPKFLINQLKQRDKKSMWFLGAGDVSAENQCSIIPKDSFENPADFESYLRKTEPFSKYETLPIANCSLLTDFTASEKKTLIAEYYNNTARLNWNLKQSLGAVASIDGLLGEDNFLKGINCDGFLSVSDALKSECESLKQCSSSSQGLEKTSQDTILALKAIKAIEQKLNNKNHQKKTPQQKRIFRTRKK